MGKKMRDIVKEGKKASGLRDIDILQRGVSDAINLGGISGLEILGDISSSEVMDPTRRLVEKLGDPELLDAFEELKKAIKSARDEIFADMIAGAESFLGTALSGDLSTIGGAVAGAGGQAIGMAIGGPATGEALGSLISMLVDGLLSLIEGTEEYAELMKRVSQTFERILTEFAPVAQAVVDAVLPAFGMFAALLEVIGPLVQRFFEMEVVTDLIFQALKQIAVALAGLLMVFMAVAEAVNGLVSGINRAAFGLNIIGVIGQIFSNMLKATIMALVEVVAIFLSQFEALTGIFVGTMNLFIDPMVGLAQIVDAVKNFFIDLGVALLTFANFVSFGLVGGLQDGIDALEELRGTQFEDMARADEDRPRAMDGFENPFSGIVQNIRDVTDGLDDLTGITDDLAGAKIDELNASEDLKEKLTNVPEGFKVALARFNAINPELGAADAGRGIEFGSEGGLTVIMERVEIVTDNDRDLFERIRDVATGEARNTGTAFPAGRMRSQQGR
jgi:hypothetical protein